VPLLVEMGSLRKTSKSKFKITRVTSKCIIQSYKLISSISQVSPQEKRIIVKPSIIYDPNPNVTKQDIEDPLTSVTGEFGLYQAIWCTLCALNSITTGLLVFSNKFFTYKVS